MKPRWPWRRPRSLFSAAETGDHVTDIYLRVVWALACHFLERDDEAKRILLDAMRLALPHGFITPFAEPLSDFGGLIEACIEQTYPPITIPSSPNGRTRLKTVSFHNISRRTTFR
jgi:hypothetical protein